ncbi:MAG: hypothetical protein R3C56_02180 [Pirellulaceae bacterium]
MSSCYPLVGGATAVLIGLLGLRINPGRSDAWAGCLGVRLALIVFFGDETIGLD